MLVVPTGPFPKLFLFSPYPLLSDPFGFGPGTGFTLLMPDAGPPGISGQLRLTFVCLHLFAKTLPGFQAIHMLRAGLRTFHRCPRGNMD